MPVLLWPGFSSPPAGTEQAAGMAHVGRASQAGPGALGHPAPTVLPPAEGSPGRTHPAALRAVCTSGGAYSSYSTVWAGSLAPSAPYSISLIVNSQELLLIK